MNIIYRSFLITLTSALMISFIGPSFVSANESMKSGLTNLTNNAENQALTFETSPQSISLIEKPMNPVQGEVQPAWTWIAKKALLNAIRYGGTALGTLIKKIPGKWATKAGDAIGKWGNVAANALEKLDNWTQNSIELALVGVGIPPADAILIARFVAFFI